MFLLLSDHERRLSSPPNSNDGWWTHWVHIFRPENTGDQIWGFLDLILHVSVLVFIVGTALRLFCLRLLGKSIWKQYHRVIEYKETIQKWGTSTNNQQAPDSACTSHESLFLTARAARAARCVMLRAAYLFTSKSGHAKGRSERGSFPTRWDHWNDRPRRKVRSWSGNCNTFDVLIELIT